VGSGIVGASSAYHLARRGHAVTLFEQFALGHDRGSSHGNSRIVRKAYPDPFYTQIMLDAYPMWTQLERECGSQVLFECGLVVFGAEGCEGMRGVVSALRSLGVEHEVAAAEDARRWMPRLRLAPGEIAVRTPEAGWVHAERAVRHLVTAAAAHGAEPRHERVESLESLESRHDAVVLAAGAWNRSFLNLPVEVTLQTFAYIDTPQPGPVWIEESDDPLYGFPSEPGVDRFKVGVHGRGAAIDPDASGREPDPAALAAIQSLAVRRFGVSEPVLVGAKGCLYTSTSNEDFLFGRVGDKTVFASACSGHGFKFGPWVGRTLADFVEGKSDPSEFPRFLFRAERRA